MRWAKNGKENTLLKRLKQIIVETDQEKQQD